MLAIHGYNTHVEYME